MSGLQVKPGTSWAETYARCVSVAPEAFPPAGVARRDLALRYQATQPAGSDNFGQ